MPPCRSSSRCASRRWRRKEGCIRVKYGFGALAAQKLFTNDAALYGVTALVQRAAPRHIPERERCIGKPSHSLYSRGSGPERAAAVGSDDDRCNPKPSLLACWAKKLGLCYSIYWVIFWVPFGWSHQLCLLYI